MKKLLIAVLLLALSVPGIASALTYSPTVADIAGWTNLGGSSTENTFEAPQVGTTKVKFGGVIYGETTEPSLGYIGIGEIFSTPLDLSGYSEYGLRIFNGNESVWDYALFVSDGTNTAYSVPNPTPIVNQTGATLLLDLTTSGLDLDNIVALGFKISQIVPIPAEEFDDRDYETIVSPVPEPGTMLLLGAGFLGLAIYGKRRKNA